MAFRSVPRPSSPPGAKASTECPYHTPIQLSVVSFSDQWPVISDQESLNTNAKHQHTKRDDRTTRISIIFGTEPGPWSVP
jgi:hypothetical protein